MTRLLGHVLGHAPFYALSIFDGLHCSEDGALGGAVAFDGEFDLAAQHGLERRHRNGTFVVLHHDGAVGLLERELLCYRRACFRGRPAGLRD
jgi:hypothetical protein